jgi:hypothetical protein
VPSKSQKQAFFNHISYKNKHLAGSDPASTPLRSNSIKEKKHGYRKIILCRRNLSGNQHTPKEYLPALLEIVKGFCLGVLKPADESFEQGMRDVMENNTRSVSELWKGIDA